MVSTSFEMVPSTNSSMAPTAPSSDRTAELIRSRSICRRYQRREQPNRFPTFRFVAEDTAILISANSLRQSAINVGKDFGRVLIARTTSIEQTLVVPYGLSVSGVRIEKNGH